jgi:hypothetical protein
MPLKEIRGLQHILFLSLLHPSHEVKSSALLGAPTMMHRLTTGTKPTAAPDHEWKSPKLSVKINLPLGAHGSCL